eukprot:COSAG01_NODE_698_length_14177_cov_13.550039_15_plen_112_part_00
MKYPGAPEEKLRLCFMTADSGHGGRVVKQELIKLLKSCYSLLPPMPGSPAEGSSEGGQLSSEEAVGSDAWVESRYDLRRWLLRTIRRSLLSGLIYIIHQPCLGVLQGRGNF